VNTEDGSGFNFCTSVIKKQKESILPLRQENRIVAIWL
jgi:hypothetical protein